VTHMKSSTILTAMRIETPTSRRGADKPKTPELITRGVFPNEQAMKEQIRKALSKRTYNVQDFYKTEGIGQRIARHAWFEHFALAVITLNAIWIGIDTEYNKKELLVEADAVFIVLENIFCVFFAFEWLVRVIAFEKKLNMLRDMWIIFDGVLVFFMIVETWILCIVSAFRASGSSGMDPSALRLIRLLRLTRMARMARIFRAVPELMIMMKGLVAGIRPVTVTLSMLTLVIYIFGVFFAQSMRDTAVGSEYFSTVNQSMGTLLLHCVFLEDIPSVFKAAAAESPFFVLGLLVFVLIGPFLVVNLLVGVMVETVRVVSACEREQLTVSSVRDKLYHMMEETNFDSDNDHLITKAEFYRLIQIPQALKMFEELGVDVVGLLDVVNRVFDAQPALEFAEFMDLTLQLRGSNKATVKDVINTMHFLRDEFSSMRSLWQDSIAIRRSRAVPPLAPPADAPSA